MSQYITQQARSLPVRSSLPLLPRFLISVMLRRASTDCRRTRRGSAAQRATSRAGDVIKEASTTTMMTTPGLPAFCSLPTHPRFVMTRPTAAILLFIFPGLSFPFYLLFFQVFSYAPRLLYTLRHDIVYSYPISQINADK